MSLVQEKGLEALESSLRYAVGQCALGGTPTRFLAAWDGESLCALLLADDDGELLRDLKQRFPGQDPLPMQAAGTPEPEFAALALLDEVCALLEGRRERLSQPLTPRGTPFQQRVWAALQAIPAGSTTTYAGLAETLGLPTTAVRAVAGACAANPLAVAVPCHRVVRGDGALAGYRWGLERKRALLRREAEQAAAAGEFCLVP